MTTIAWDGKTLAADTLIATGNTVSYGTKIRRILTSPDSAPDGWYIGRVGDMAVSLAIMNWWVQGASINDFPREFMAEDCQTTLVVCAKNHPVLVYSGCPYPQELSSKFYATGSGRDFAIAAMHCGRTAKEAVEIACLYDVYSGGSVDVLGDS